MIVINLADHNDFITEVLLDGQVYFLHFGWNSEWRQWEMGIENTRNERIIAGVPVNPFTDILGAYRRLAIPQGAFIVLLENGDTLGRQSFVTGLASLIYLTVEERDNANGNLVQALLRD